MEVESDKLKVEKSDLAKKEEEILKFWQEKKIFEETVNRPAPAGDFVFYDGPPFATGLPHFGHLLPTSIKDAIPRYQTMRGKRVLRRWGWDCHGLPIENLIEKELGLKSKKDIEQYGLAHFNDQARASVLRYADEWRKVIPRMGRWVDMENDYKTMNPSYTESVWWVFKTLADKGLVYEGYKSMHLCPRCETTLANFEVNLGYKDVTDISVYAKFELVDEPGTYLLAWTTTPWTLPGNAALAVNEKIAYSKLKVKSEKVDLPDGKAGSEFIILAKDRVAEVLKDKEFEVVGDLSGKDLVGKKYKPLFDYYQGSTLKDVQGRTLESDLGWQVYSADFVTALDGTGIVHVAPAFGEDDMKLGEEKKLPFIQHVSRDGKFKPEVTDFAGLPVKPKEDPQSADILVIKYLAGKKALFAKEKIVHSYPHCWRCDTPLLNYAASSWFIKVTELKEKLLAENKKVNWIPEHIQDGRFGKWLEGARDWAVSRQRFWGAPLPVWRCAECKKVEILAGVDDLKKSVKKSGNQYFVMRHGEAENNVKEVASSDINDGYGLTERGQKQVKEATPKLKSEKVSKIFASPFLRTRQSAELIALELGIPTEKIIFDDRLKEFNFGDFSGKPFADYLAFEEKNMSAYVDPIAGGESYLEAKRRFGDFIYELETSFSNETILIVTHGIGPEVLEAIIRGADGVESKKIIDTLAPPLAQPYKLDFKNLPHNPDYELDFHRPFIDEVKLNCECKGEMKRIEDVFDVWFESGSMPYGQTGYHGEDPKPPFPAQFIAEGVDQTRGWFYSLLVLGVGLFGQSPYENVIVNGLILAEDGQKMSKRLNNYPDLNLTINKYGADALRFYLLSSPSVRAEDFSFSERGLGEVMRRVIMRLKNVLAFYQLYATPETISAPTQVSDNLLDLWINARLAELNQSVSQALDSYQLDQLGQPIDSFVDDLSTWYLRRSRERLKAEDKEVQLAALQTLRQTLMTLAKIIAPIMPFVAEEIYQALRGEKDLTSVHLTNWPESYKLEARSSKLLEEMREVRRIASLALEARAKNNLKVRQPLATLFVRQFSSPLNPELIEIIKDEVNVKAVVEKADLATEVELDTVLTPELVAEGEKREVVREIQDLRKQAGLNPGQPAVLTVANNYERRALIEREAEALKKLTSLREIKFSDTSDAPLSLSN